MQTRDFPEYTVMYIVFKIGLNQLQCAVIFNVQMVATVNLTSPNQKDFAFVRDHGLEKNVKTLIRIYVGINTKKKYRLVSLQLNMKSL